MPYNRRAKLGSFNLAKQRLKGDGIVSNEQNREGEERVKLRDNDGTNANGY